MLEYTFVTVNLKHFLCFRFLAGHFLLFLHWFSFCLIGTLLGFHRFGRIFLFL